MSGIVRMVSMEETQIKKLSLTAEMNVLNGQMLSILLIVIKISAGGMKMEQSLVVGIAHAICQIKDVPTIIYILTMLHIE